VKRSLVNHSRHLTSLKIERSALSSMLLKEQGIRSNSGWLFPG